MPEISVIIPVFNSAQYLNRCFDSLINQTFTDFEVVLIDDGSTDDSGALCDKIASEDSRFRTFHTQNQGSSLARQYGIERAICDKLVFIDSDDDVHHLYLQHLLDAMIRNNVDIAMCDMQKVSNDSKPKPINAYSDIILNNSSFHKLFFGYKFWGFWGKIYKKELFDGIYFPQYNINEDYVVMAQLFSCQDRVAYVHEALYNYRNNPNSQSHLKLTPRIMGEYYNKLWVADYYATNKPEYASQAKEQLVESCIKTISIINAEDKFCHYSEEKIKLQRFIRKNLFFILFRSNMLMGLRIMSIWRTLK
ncbi:MAG: glycosyltransferase family 2 protein [Muribaculaceae bacterium]